VATENRVRSVGGFLISVTLDTDEADFFDLAAILPFAQRFIFEIKVGL
jgi:hypothetical protein